MEMFSLSIVYGCPKVLRWDIGSPLPGNRENRKCWLLCIFSSVCIFCPEIQPCCVLSLWIKPETIHHRVTDSSETWQEVQCLRRCHGGRLSEGFSVCLCSFVWVRTSVGASCRPAHVRQRSLINGREYQSMQIFRCRCGCFLCVSMGCQFTEQLSRSFSWPYHFSLIQRFRRLSSLLLMIWAAVLLPEYQWEHSFIFDWKRVTTARLWRPPSQRL